MIAFSARCGSKGPFRCAARLWVSINERRVEFFCSAAAVCGRFGGSSGRDPVLGGADALGAGALELWLRRGGVLALGAAWGVCLALRPYAVQSSPILIPLAGTVVIGLAQLLTAHTANRWETWNAVLRWAVYLTAFFLASQIGASQDVLRPFRLALLYFGFGISVVAVLQYFTSPGQVFWIFQSEYSGDVFGPFVNRDHYAAFIELILPMALFEALSDRRKVLFGAVMAGTMVASVIAGASRAGSVLVILESAAVLLLASRRGVRSARKVTGRFAALVVVCSLAFTAVVGWTRVWEKFQDPDPYRGRREMLN